MRRIFLFVLTVLAMNSVFAQTDSASRSRMLSHKTTSRSGDHLMIQLGYLSWNGAPDSITTGGLPRTANVYFLFDFPFKTNPHWSAAIGAGIATDHMYFDKMTVGIKDATPKLVFRNGNNSDRFKKYKLATTYAEAPVELRYSSNPDNNKRSVKAALGVKAGVLLSAMAKGKDLENSSGNSIGDYTVKEKSKAFFNKNRISGTARLGYGNLSIFGAYQLTPLFKEGVAAEIRPFSVGITLSGL